MLLLLLPLCAALSLAQNSPEVTTQDDPATFQSKVTLILVPVTVRDKNGNAVGTLRKEDFQLSDKGKPQAITQFSVEKPGGKAVVRTQQSERPAGEKIAPPVIAPDHFIGLLFDDVHVNYQDLAFTRAAAQKFIASGLKSADRAAIFTTSGETTLDFTDDREMLNQTLLKLSPHPVARAVTQDQECPNIDFFLADRVVNRMDKDALGIAVSEVMRCWHVQPYAAAVAVAESQARDKLLLGARDTHVAIGSLKEAVRRLARMPGQRTLILASPGFFFLPDQFPDEASAIDLAVRSGVTISSLSARGLTASDPNQGSRRRNLGANAAFAEAGILSDLAAGTGGAFIENTNDLAKGFQQLATPDVYYVLGFSPENLKPDGAFHTLKVTVKATPGLSIEARHGYFAPDHSATAEETAKEEIGQALFSRDEMRGIPVDIQTQFFKASESDARLAVISRVDVKKLRFRKADGRNTDDVRIVAALFDRNGNYVQSVSKTVQLRLFDDTLQSKLDSGITVRSDFNIAPGTYVIRLVVRDSEGQTMAARNGAVEIP